MKKELDKELYPDYVYPEFTPDPGKPFREPIAKLGKKITDRIPQKLGLKKITRNDPEYWGLAGVLTDEEALLALKLGVRKPKTLSEIVKISGLEEKKCEALLEEMSRKGLLEYNWENAAHEKQYVLPMYVPGCAEFFNMNAKILESNPEMGTFFEHMSRLPLEKITPFVPEGGAGIGMHVIPVEKAIEMENESVDLEHISYWLSKYEGKYAASPCSCRRSRLTHDEGCADDPEGWCVAVGDMADYVVETQKDGRYISKEEALDIFRQAEENGFVHQITNIDGKDKIFAICNAETRFIPKKTIPSLKGGFEEKIAIIGAGPAGLSCAYFLALTGYKPTIFEKNAEPGGMLRYGIPSYKLEKNLLAAEIDVIRQLGVEIRCGVEIGKDVTIEDLREQGYKGFYAAIGCQRGRKPGISGENAEGAYTAVDFLRKAGASLVSQFVSKCTAVRTEFHMEIIQHMSPIDCLSY